MQLGKKKQVQKTYQNNDTKYKKDVPVNWETETINPDAEIPYGKYKGQTLSDVMEGDPKYYTWIEQNNLLGSWGLTMPKKKEQVHKKDIGFLTSDGEMWLSIYEVPGTINNNANTQIPY